MIPCTPDGLLGIAGMMKLLVMKWIIPENSLRLYSTSKSLGLVKSLASSDARPSWRKEIVARQWQVFFWDHQTLSLKASHMSGFMWFLPFYWEWGKPKFGSGSFTMFEVIYHVFFPQNWNITSFQVSCCGLPGATLALSFNVFIAW